MTDDMQQIEQDFKASWNGLYTSFQYTLSMRNDVAHQRRFELISEMMRRGYNVHFRIGVQMDTLIISRARQHGLRQGQAYIRFAVTLDKLYVTYEKLTEQETLEFNSFDYNDEIDALVQRLLQEPIT